MPRSSRRRRSTGGRARAMSLQGIVLQARARPPVDLRRLELRGIGLDLVPDDDGEIGRSLWARHILAAVEGRPRGPLTWPSAVPDLASLPALRSAVR